MTPERSEDLEAAKQMQDADNAARWQVFMQIAAVDVAREALRGLLLASLVGMWLFPVDRYFRGALLLTLLGMVFAYTAQWAIAERLKIAPIFHGWAVGSVLFALLAMYWGLAHV